MVRVRREHGTASLVKEGRKDIPPSYRSLRAELVPPAPIFSQGDPDGRDGVVLQTCRAAYDAQCQVAWFAFLHSGSWLSC